MILKEAYRYQNYLNDLLDEAETYLTDGRFISNTYQKHERSKKEPKAIDEDIVVEKPYDINCTPEDLVILVEEILSEKSKLSNAIATAKRNLDVDIDSILSLNIYRRDFKNTLKRMLGVKKKETLKKGLDYTFNVNNEQVEYKYDIKEIVEPDFDTQRIKELFKETSKECDETSSLIDKLQIETEVDYIPKWDINDDLNGIVG